jgi:predicted RNA-binding Zn-ribbon protein involved in translation (DUF1610 family)
MQQLVGCLCGVCAQPIADILEGSFCPACGNAVHHRCKAAVDAVAHPGHCPSCGSDQSNPAAKRVQFERAQDASGKRGARYPIAVGKVCPACGDARFRRVRPQRLVSFALDRVCLACETRYTPPTPIWAAAIMIFAGLALIVVALVGGFFSVMAVDIIALALEAFVGLLGALALGHGIRSLVWPGKA